jgi:hypothetical protein
METFSTTVLLLVALALPVVLFLVFRPRSRTRRLLAAAVAIAAGWAFNVAFVVASEAMAANHAAPPEPSNLAIAANFGWACPLVLVLVTWLAWHVATRGAGRSEPA